MRFLSTSIYPRQPVWLLSVREGDMPHAEISITEHYWALLGVTWRAREPCWPYCGVMELKGKLADAINDQITLEIQAAIVYRQLAIEMDVHDLPGISGWFLAQSGEELVHAQKFTSHMTDRDAAPKIGTITAPDVTINTVLEAFEASLAHEKKVSESIRNLYRLAQQEGDIDSIPLLNWFIEEQLEEEATVGEIIGRVRLIGSDGNGLLRLDSELGARKESGE